MVLKTILGWLTGGGAEEQPAPEPRAAASSPADPAPPAQPAAAPPPAAPADPEAPGAGPPPVDAPPFDAVAEGQRRRAIRMKIGGFAAPEGPGGSWFGRVSLALPGEGWPTSDGAPLHALAQIDLTTLPFRPPRLEDVAMITVFITDEPPFDTPNGEGWCLRAYPDLAALVPLDAVDTGSQMEALPMRPEIVEADYNSYPDWAALGIDPLHNVVSRYNRTLPKVVERYNRECITVPGFKLGGWPSLFNDEIAWGEWDRLPSRPEYVFQIDSTDEGNWMWGDSGVGFFGRGTRPGHTDEWVLSWDCA